MASKIDEDFTYFDECTSMTGTYIHHESYSLDYIYDVYRNEQVNSSGFDHNTTDDFLYLSPST